MSLSKKIVAILVIIAIMGSIIISKSYAALPTNTGDYTLLEFGGGATDITNVSNGDSVTITYPNGTVSVTGTGLYSAKEQGNNGQNQMVDKYNVYATGNVTVTANPSNGYTANLWSNGSSLNSNTTSFNGLTAGGAPKQIDAVFTSNTNTNPNPGSNNDYEDVNVTVNYIGTYGEVQFNDYGEGRTPEGQTYNGTVKAYKDSSKTNKIAVRTAVGEQPAKTITINGVAMTGINGTDENEFELAGAAGYTITVEADSQAVTPKTVIWVNPDYEPKTEEDKQWVKDFSIGHGYARAIEVYDPNGHKLNPADYINTTVQPDGSKSDDYGLNNGFGWVKILPGSKVVFDFVPEYGYQLTSISINGVAIKATSTMNRFEFTMPEGSGNIHFAATFSKTEDVLKTNSDKVTSGSVSMGDNKLNGGSVQIKVSDADVEPSKIKGFEGAAGDYKVSNILDIDLYNVFYKGKADSDDVWSNQIEELDGYVTITIKLADDVDGNEIVLVHNIHDGEEYEVIPTTYDPETHTITFRTKSFSNYAIASKTVEKAAEIKTSDTPNTGDSIISAFAVFAVAGAGLFVTKKMKSSKLGKRYSK